MEQTTRRINRLFDNARNRPALMGVALFCIIAIVAACVHACSSGESGVVIDKEPASEFDQTSDQDASAESADPSVTAITVYVSGRVATAGVYELEEGSRVVDALALAGGALDSAALDSLNLARKLTDGEHIYVPSVDEGDDVSAAADSSGGGSTQNGKVNINTATVEQLDALEGIGPSIAERIVRDRTENGPFASIEDLKRVSGIGDKKFEALAQNICVG